MTGRKVITASLEGMRVLVDEKRCELEEYNFSLDQWIPKDAAPWPLPRAVAENWLAGWNGVDRFAAVSALVGPTDSPGEHRAGRRLAEPSL